MTAALGAGTPQYMEVALLKQIGAHDSMPPAIISLTPIVRKTCDSPSVQSPGGVQKLHKTEHTENGLAQKPTPYMVQLLGPNSKLALKLDPLGWNQTRTPSFLQIDDPPGSS